MVAAQSSTGASQTELDAAVEDIKAAADELDATVDTADLTFEQRLQVATLLDLSLSIRDDNTATLSPDTWIAQLRQLQSGVTKLITTITSAQNTPEPRLELLAQALGGRFSLAMQQALGSDEQRSRSVSQALYSELGAESAAIDRLAGALDDAESAVRTLRTNNGERTRAVRTGTSTELGGADAYDEYDNLSEALLTQVDQGLAATAANAQDRALLRRRGDPLRPGFAAIALALVISRSLLGPIRRVREGALQVANEQLPEAVARIRAGGEPAELEPIDVHTHEEIGQLARAVDDLHRQAVTLASGEAKLRTQVGEMFVTLSRRNTTLINQQLNLIETLEKDEEDPKRLESLFRLDHLASRMRRTSDSLLILADAPARSTGWESITVGEATQAATAGVQDYQRVVISSTLESRVGEAAAGDLIHLLTELVDNALSYSSPSTNVTLGTAPAPGGLTIDVRDSGLGIPEESLRQINETLETGADVTPDTARRMGLFVVSRLAKRHGISVALATNAASGITATVFVPESVLLDGAPAMPEAVEAAPEVDEPDARAVRAAGRVGRDPRGLRDSDVRREAEAPAEDAGPPRRPSSASRPASPARRSRPASPPPACRRASRAARSPSVASPPVSTPPCRTPPSARNTAAPKPKRGAMPLRSRRTALTEDGSTGTTGTSGTEELAPAAASSVETPYADAVRRRHRRRRRHGRARGARRGVRLQRRAPRGAGRGRRSRTRRSPRSPRCTTRPTDSADADAETPRPIRRAVETPRSRGRRGRRGRGRGGAGRPGAGARAPGRRDDGAHRDAHHRPALRPADRPAPRGAGRRAGRARARGAGGSRRTGRARWGTGRWPAHPSPRWHALGPGGGDQAVPRGRPGCLGRARRPGARRPGRADRAGRARCSRRPRRRTGRWPAHPSPRWHALGPGGGDQAVPRDRPDLARAGRPRGVRARRGPGRRDARCRDARRRVAGRRAARARGAGGPGRR